MFGSNHSTLRTSSACRGVCARRASATRSGFTLLELLIATAITLLMMISLVQVFKVVGDSMKQGRAVLQLNNTLRSATFRLRNDLNNLTVRVDPPLSSRSGSGYLEYFDGAMTDYTCTLFDELNAINPDLTYSAVRSSRFGDLDDILMFTARAGGDTWFVGQVPSFVLNPALLADPTPPDTDGDGTLDAFEMVSINSQFAEIVVFARPVSTDTTGATLFDDADGNRLPDAYQLYYRTLLIRPDLNVTIANGSASLPNTLPLTLPAWLYAGPKSPSALPAPLDMALAHQQCDLSIRRVYDGSPGADAIAANSLEDLMNPANRFAHFEYHIPSSIISGSVSTTMPLLVLQPIPRVTGGLPGTCINVFGNDGVPTTFSPLYSDPNPGAMPVGLAGAAGNFLHPNFVLAGTRRGEDVLTSDCLGFDVKIYDSGAPILGVVGVDGISGNGTSTTLGADGSDDVILTPNDPGYAAAIASSSAPINVSYGAYVDLMWGRKTLSSLPCFPGSPTVGTVFINQPSVNLWTEFSGLTKPALPLPSTAAPPLEFAEGLRRSGKFLRLPSAPEPPVLLQPTFDTWSSQYENDSLLQGELAISPPNTLRGIVNVNHFKRQQDKNLPATDVTRVLPLFRQTNIDAGADGVDNNQSGGVDESFEHETLPPFPVRPRGIKISIRLEDRATRQVKQMSVATEFVTQ